MTALACFLAGFGLPAAACVNTFESNIRHYQDQGDEDLVAGEIAKLEADYQDDRSLEHTNDLAVGRLLTRHYPEAIELLRDAEQRFPGKAIVAANLGTAYELSGNNQEALRWIREGVRRDPEEHSGTEWLHVKILEAKLAVAQDPDWLKKNTVLGLSFGESGMPVMPASLPLDESGKPRAPVAIGNAISYQLHERTKFVRPPDAVVADLYAALGDLSYSLGKPESWESYFEQPDGSYESALNYGPARRELVDLRRRHFKATYPADSWQMSIRNEVPMVAPRRSPWLWLVAVAFLAAIGGVVYAARRRVTKP